MLRISASITSSVRSAEMTSLNKYPWPCSQPVRIREACCAESCLCSEAEAISEDSAKVRAIQKSPLVTEPRKKSHPQPALSGYDSIRLDRIQIIHTFVRPPSEGFAMAPQVVFR